MKTAIVLILAIPVCAWADEETPIATDRPGFSDGSNIVPLRSIQLETGFFRTFIRGGDSVSAGDMLLRYGTSRNSEIRLIGLSYGFGPGGAQSFLDPSIGFKSRIVEGTSNRPEVTLIGQTTVPVGSHPLRANAWNPTFKLAATLPLGTDAIGSNVVLSRQGASGAQFDQSAISFFWSHPLTSRAAITTEVWGLNRISAGGSAAAFASVAGTYLLNPTSQIDLRIGSGFNQGRDVWLLQGGFSRRF